MARVLKKAVCVFDLALSGLGVGDQYIKSYFQLSDWIVLLIKYFIFSDFLAESLVIRKL